MTRIEDHCFVPFEQDQLNDHCATCGRPEIEHEWTVEAEVANPEPENDLRKQMEQVEMNCRVVLDEIAARTKEIVELQEKFNLHVKAVGDFLTELHAIMIDPLADGTTSVDEMMTLLREAALESREKLNRYADLEMTVRREWWFNHGHSGLYGDDGEMQCPDCARYGCWDYLRQDFQELGKHVQLVRWEHVARTVKP